MTIGYYIYIASMSGYYSKTDWQSWADRQIMDNDEVEEWIYKVSLVKDIEDLCTAVYDKKIEERYYTDLDQYDLINNEMIRKSVNATLYEAQASIMEQGLHQNLSQGDRIMLIRDGIQRLRNENLKPKDVSHLLDITER